MMDEDHGGISGRSRKRQYFYITEEYVLTLLLSVELTLVVLFKKKTLLNILPRAFLKNSSCSFLYSILL